MNIAVIGSGGREHAIVSHLVRWNNPDKVYVFSQSNILPNSVQFDVTNFALLRDFCKKLNVELLIVGPETFLEQGISDFFQDSDIRVFGPTKKGAQLESSKIWAKNFMKKYSVATADFQSFKNVDQAENYLEHCKESKMVVKYDGLAFGKGVFVCENKNDANKALKLLAKNYGKDIGILIEERLSGPEISLITVCAKDSKGFPSIQLLGTARDYKRAYDGALGPNTGGMGVISPHPDWSEALKKEIYQAIVNPTLQGLQSERLDFYGFLYFGIMLTKNGPKLLEYNTRLGDPEAQVILTAMEEDLASIITNALNNNLTDRKTALKDEVFIDIALVSKGYPGDYEIKQLITGIDNLNKETSVFYSAVSKENDKLYSDGGRVMHLVSYGSTLNQAKDKVYKECEKIHFNNIYYRKDIGENVEG
jgi:phosphoribosylamine---glycine ligase